MDVALQSSKESTTYEPAPPYLEHHYQDISHFTDSYPRFPQLKKAMQQFPTYIVNIRACIPNYG
jgi:hypothetical protein